MRACHHFDDLAAGRSRKAMERVSFVRLWHLLLPQRPSTPESTAHWVLAWQKTSSPQRSFPYHRRDTFYSCLPLRAQCPFRCHTPEPPKVKPKKYPKGHLYAEFDLCPNKCVPRGPETTVQKNVQTPHTVGRGDFVVATFTKNMPLDRKPAAWSVLCAMLFWGSGRWEPAPGGPTAKFFQPPPQRRTPAIRVGSNEMK